MSTSVKLDPSASLRTLDLTQLASDRQVSRVVAAIYSIDGELLKVCMGKVTRRPREMKPPPRPAGSDV